MTREEREQALEWFKNRPITMSGAKKMYDLAISALEQPEPCEDTISRHAAIDALGEEPPVWYDGENEIAERDQWRRDVNAIKAVLSAQPDRDIPKKPKEETDTSLGCRKIPVCPECDRHLSFVAFIESGKGKKITYCEHCGQAIDWEGWVFDE